MVEEICQPNASEKPPSRSLLKWIYRPWCVLVVVPFFIVATLVCAVAAVATTRVFGPRAAFHCGTAWGWLVCRSNFTRVTITGRERVDPTQSYVIMSNHQSYFDVLSFYGHWRKQFRWVMKQELRKVPALGWACEVIGHIFIDRSDRAKAIASLQAARSLLVDGVSVLFFPEGTRSGDGVLREFKKGGFMMAYDLGLPILPISISGSHKTMPDSWFDPFPGHIRITVHEPIDISTYTLEDRARLMADVRAAIMEGLTPYEQGQG